jgi:peptidoglycan/xylan/chitin deacetylase (PgdA/CDA1 family)
LASEHTVYAFSDEYNSNVVTNVTVEFMLSTGAKDYEWLGDAEATGGAWKMFSSQITVPEGTTSLTVLHGLDKNGSLKIGNVSLTAMRADPFPQGMVTLVFDDGRASQFKNARPILNAAGLKTTYAIITHPQRVRDASIKAFMTWAEITMLHDEGNEIAAHSRAHRDLTTLTPSEMQGEVRGAYQDLVTRGLTPDTFVYPYGGVNSNVERLVRSTGFSGARGSYFGLDGACTDKFNLRDILVGETTPAKKIKHWIDQAIAQKRWLVLELHDVLSEGGDEYSIMPKKLRSIVTYIRHTGIQVVTLQEGIRLMNSERANPPECRRWWLRFSKTIGKTIEEGMPPEGDSKWGISKMDVGLSSPLDWRRAKYDGVWELPALGAVTAPTAVLIRPDGPVAWAGDRHPLGLPDALTTWFGPPTAA